MIDPKFVYLLAPRWTEIPMVDPRPEPLCVGRRDSADGTFGFTLSFPTDGSYRKCLSFKARVGEPIGERESIVSWGLSKLGPGVWMVQPSLHVPGVLHAFLVLRDVPEPAPWEPPAAKGEKP